eukprot:5860116-Amphidinium_carterae.1
MATERRNPVGGREVTALYRHMLYNHNILCLVLSPLSVLHSCLNFTSFCERVRATRSSRKPKLEAVRPPPPIPPPVGPAPLW